MIILCIGIVLITVSIIWKKKYSPYWGFLFVLLVMGFQNNVNGDYYGYLDYFNYGNLLSVKKSEFAWIWLNQLFRNASFPLMIFCIAFIQYLILSIAVNKYTFKRYQFLGAILFFFTFACMLIQMKAIRQGLAIELCLAAFILADARKFAFSILLLVIAYGIHNASVVIFPFYLAFIVIKILSLKKQRLNINLNNAHPWRFPIIIFIASVLLFFLKQKIIDQYLLPFAYSVDFKYSGYISEIEFVQLSWFIVLNYTIMAFTTAIYFQQEKGTKKYLALLALVSIFGNIVFFGLGSLQRAIHYFTIFTIITYPNIAEMLRKKFGFIFSSLFVLWNVAFAIKISIGWLITTNNDAFGSYKFIFMN